MGDPGWDAGASPTPPQGTVSPSCQQALTGVWLPPWRSHPLQSCTPSRTSHTRTGLPCDGTVGAQRRVKPECAPQHFTLSLIHPHGGPGLEPRTWRAGRPWGYTRHHPGCHLRTRCWQ